MARQWWRIGGLLGIVFPIVLLIGVIGLQGDEPDLHAPIAEVRAYFTDHGDRYLIGEYLIVLSTVLFFLPFIVGLSAVLSRVEGAPAIWSRPVLVGGVVFVAVGFIINGGATLAMGARDPELDSATVRTLSYVETVAFSRQSLPVALMLLAAAVVIWRTAVVWRWLAVLGLVAALAGLVSPLMVLDGGDEEGPFAALAFVIAYSGLGLWTLLVGVNLLMRRDLPAEAAAQRISAGMAPAPTP